MFVPMSVACEDRKNLPDISIYLSGENFTLSPWDYTLEWPVRDHNGRRCASAFQPLDAKDSEIVLGSAFLKAFYSVFDLDNGSISCKFHRAIYKRTNGDFNSIQLPSCHINI
jgi:saccharopepsin